MENTMFVIVPYFKLGTWVFTDTSTGLVNEPFVSGVPEIINELVKNLKNPQDGFVLYFSSSLFPDYQIKLDFEKYYGSGCWYIWKDKNLRGWFCPALFKYFESPPKELYGKANELSKEDQVLLS